MSAENQLPGKIDSEKVNKVCQEHINKLIPVVSKVEVEILTNDKLSIEELLTYYRQQRDLEGCVSWILALEKRYNPQKVIPVRNMH